MFFNRKKVALSLGSGSAKGLAHIGVIDALIEKKYQITAIAGSSIGAVIGAYYAFGKLDDYKKYVLSLDKRKVFSLFDFNLFPSKGLMDGDKICKFLMSTLGEQNIEDADIKLMIVATDLNTGEPIVFEKGSLIDAIRASISIPGIFTPATIGSKIYVDGAVSMPLPNEVLREKGYKKVISVNLNKHLSNNINGDLPNIITTFYKSFSIMNYYQTMYSLECHPPKILIEPDLKNIGMFDYHKAKDIIEKGYRSALKVI
ncbi:patatin-like phospholipase family protein [Deferribacteraceae bacterium V6Fe1]|nr:patatin-like phospholipase family protein [Deferribacteraceae bacterium V6Fe1]